MRENYKIPTQLVYSTALCYFAFASSLLVAQDSSPKKTVEPVFRVPKIFPNQVDNNRTLNQLQDNRPIVQPHQPKVNTNRPVGTTTEAPRRVAPPQTQRPIARVARVPEINTRLDNKPVSIVPDSNLSKVTESGKPSHPLDRAVELARTGLVNMRENVVDYTAIMVKRERVGDKLSEPNYMRIKIRNPRQINNQKVPFSIYMKFIKPRNCSGREVIWVDGQNNNNLVAHETSPLLRFKNFHLEPTGMLAMKGNKYPIYDAGLENLILKLIEKAERDRAAGQCEVKYLDGAQINKRPCTVIEVKHNQRRAPYEFHMAKVYIDDELGIPVRFVSYDWPTPGSKPKIIEEYTYIDVKLNVGLSDSDFSISNPSYGFAK